MSGRLAADGGVNAGFGAGFGTPWRGPRAPPPGPVARCGGLSGRTAASALCAVSVLTHRDGADDRMRRAGMPGSVASVAMSADTVACGRCPAWAAPSQAIVVVHGSAGAAGGTRSPGRGGCEQDRWRQSPDGVSCARHDWAQPLGAVSSASPSPRWRRWQGHDQWPVATDHGVFCGSTAADLCPSWAAVQQRTACALATVTADIAAVACQSVGMTMPSNSSRIGDCRMRAVMMYV